jgi:aryl-alcohol dehydrogenase-like predicted oxidoreductase
MQEAFPAGTARREDVFVTTKLWSTNHRPERVKPTFDASLRRLQIDYVDCYIIHTPFAFQAGDEQDPTDDLREENILFPRRLGSSASSAPAAACRPLRRGFFREPTDTRGRRAAPGSSIESP